MIDTMRGAITSAGFTSGDRFVIGHWESSPIGPFADVMWARADGSRSLLAPAFAADFITDVYPFDDVLVTTVDVVSGRRSLEVGAGPVALALRTGRVVVPFPPRPRWITAGIENRISQRLLGVASFGTSPTGVREWYRTRRVRLVRSGEGFVDGEPCGALGPVTRPLSFGFTDPPRWPSQVVLRVDLERRT